MESLTKNRQSAGTILEMTEKFFPEDKLSDFRELTEGYFNAAYEVCLKSGKSVILKVAPTKETPVMSYEKNIMYSEVTAMRLAAGHPEIPLPRLYGFDESRTLCPSPYFFMQKLEGASLYSLQNSLSREEMQRLQFQAGRINKAINGIILPFFGLPGQPGVQGPEWFPVFRKLLQMGAQDAAARNIDLKIPVKELWPALEQDRPVFGEVQTPRLIHWDLWEGNIFTGNGRITGIIDWERCLYGDPLMEVGFRSYRKDPSFRQGYGLINPTPAEKRRILWYDIYLMLLMAQEYEYRSYETMEQYNWCTENLMGYYHRL